MSLQDTLYGNRVDGQDDEQKESSSVSSAIGYCPPFIIDKQEDLEERSKEPKEVKKI
jgi:hypothetical protein